MRMARRSCLLLIVWTWFAYLPIYNKELQRVLLTYATRDSKDRRPHEFNRLQPAVSFCVFIISGWWKKKSPSKAKLPFFGFLSLVGFFFLWPQTAAPRFGARLQFLLLLLTNFALNPLCWPRFITFPTVREKDRADSVIRYACRVTMRNFTLSKGYIVLVLSLNCMVYFIPNLIQANFYQKNNYNYSIFIFFIQN